jgi:hypothetical protein
MMNTQSVDLEGDNLGHLFEQVLAQIVGRCIQSGSIDKHQMVVLLEDMIQQVERGTLNSSLNNI